MDLADSDIARIFICWFDNILQFCRNVSASVTVRQKQVSKKSEFYNDIILWTNHNYKSLKLNWLNDNFRYCYWWNE